MSKSPSKSRRPSNKGQFKGWKPRVVTNRRKSRWDVTDALVIVAGLAFGGLATMLLFDTAPPVAVAQVESVKAQPEGLARQWTTAAELDAAQPDMGGSSARGEASTSPPMARGSFTCSSPFVVDGDTLNCSGRRVRLSGIDAPEMPGHCRQGRDCVPGDPYASKAALASLVGGGPLRCVETDVDHYGRTVALCQSGGRDLSCSQVAAGQAVRRYAPLSC